MTLQFHVDFLEDPRYAWAFAVAANEVPGHIFRLLTGDEKVALGYVVDEELDASPEEAVDAVPLDDWLFGYYYDVDNTWYVLDQTSCADGPNLTILGLHPECLCWRPYVVFNMGNGDDKEASVDNCDGIWLRADGSGFLQPMSAEAANATADEQLLRAVDDVAVPMDALNDR